MIPYNKRQDAQIVKIKDYINGKGKYVTGEGTSITLENTIEAQFTKFEIEGNSTQDGTPSPDNEVPIYSAGDNGSINEKIKNADGTEEQDYSIPVQQPMRSIGDVRDLFFKNTKDSKYYDKDLEKNKWYERHPIFRKIFIGNETFTLQSINDYGIANFNYKTGNTAYQVNGNILCNRFITQTAGISSIKTDGIYMSWGNEIYIRILASEIDTVEKLKTWLATLYTNGNPVYVDYILETPTDIECTEEQIQQLENKPSTYKDFTIIQSQDETPVIINAEAVKKLL